MELRSYNVEKIWSKVVICTIGEDVGVRKTEFEVSVPAIKEMLSQVHTVNGYAHLCACCRRTDGEIWTPYTQIVEMLIRLGAKIGCVKYSGRLKSETLVKIVV